MLHFVAGLFNGKRFNLLIQSEYILVFNKSGHWEQDGNMVLMDTRKINGDPRKQMPNSRHFLCYNDVVQHY